MTRSWMPLAVSLVSLAGCSAANGEPAEPPLIDQVGPGAQSLKGGHELLGIHNPDLSVAGTKDMLELFAGNPKGWMVDSAYSSMFDWLGGFAPPTSKEECLSKGGDGAVDKHVCARMLGFIPVVRLDYATDAAWPDDTDVKSGNLPPPGDLPFKAGIRRCPLRKGSTMKPIEKQTHLECYVHYATTYAERAGQAIKHWIVGNEINLRVEAGDFADGYISGDYYAKVYLATRDAIHSVPGHDDDIVMVAAPAFTTDSQPAATRGTDKTWDDVLGALQSDQEKVDGIAVHSYGNWTKVPEDSPAPAIDVFEQGHPDLGTGWQPQIERIESWGFGGKFLLLSEFNVGMHQRTEKGEVDAYDRKEVSEFIRDAYAGIQAWNQSSGHTPLAGAVWYSWQNGCDLNAKATDSLKCMKQTVSSTSALENPYHAFVDLAKNGVPEDEEPPCEKPWPDASPLGFSEVPYMLEGDFEAFWKKAGALAVLGFPIEDARCRKIEVGGKLVSIHSQYTQRARLEWHPANSDPYRVLLGHLGKELGPAASWTADSGPKSGCAFIGPSASQGNYVCDATLARWQEYGVASPPSFGDSLMLWGYPLGPPASFTAKDGTSITAQWFERARLELHGAMGSEYVLGGLLGCEASGITGPGC